MNRQYIPTHAQTVQSKAHSTRSGSLSKKTENAAFLKNGKRYASDSK